MTELIKTFTYKEPGPETKALIAPAMGRRYFSLSRLNRKDNLCAWCNVTHIKDRRRKYCDEDCSQSADVFCYPQGMTSKSFHLLRQDCACKGCGFIFEQEIKKKIETYKAHWPESFAKEGKISLFYLSFNRGFVWQADHIIPIHKGGVGLGLNNIQILCVDCHQDKTNRERSKC
jgi:5-methylcytosine-specific restriction endonuclease McrA